MARLSKARLRGLFPEPRPITRFEKEVEVTVSVPADLYQWLAYKFIGRDSYTLCVEQAIEMALRSMRGSKGNLNLDALAELVARRQRTSRIEAVFGEIEDDGARRAAGLLYCAAMLAAVNARADHLDKGLPKDREDDRTAIMAALEVMFPERDFEKEMEAWREDEKRRDAELDRQIAELQANPPDRKHRDLDDDIPF